MSLPSILPFARSLIESVLRKGGTAIDGTVGNGYDTLFLAETVGSEGKVYGFDIQQSALGSAREKLAKAGSEKQAILFHAGHEAMASHIPLFEMGRVSAAMFNLGYLPGSDKTCITKTETTIPALAAALEFLAPGGIMTAVLYPGHQGGDEEADSVMQWARALDSAKVRVLIHDFINQKNRSPILLAFEKKA